MKKIAILGFGLTGRAICEYFLEKNYNITIIDDRKLKEESINSYKKRNIEFILNPKKEIDFKKFDSVILSPSFRLDKDYIKTNDFSNFHTELDYFYPEIKDSTIISLTGTNGKTSSVKVLKELFERLNYKVFLGGNVGIPIVEATKNNYDIIILELSSFQLFYTKKFHTDYSVILNITPDHLQWHKDMQEYINTKFSLINITNKESYVNQSAYEQYRKDKLKNLKIYKTENLDDDLIYIKNNLKPERVVFFENFIPLFFILKKFSMSKEIFTETINSMSWEKYRLISNKVFSNNFINDSKSTNIDSTHFALKNYPNSILILSGKDKDLDYEQYIDILSSIKTKEILLFGGLADKLSFILKNFNIKKFSTLREIFIYLKNKNIQNEIILFSPGSSSFDLYDNYIKRGEDFDSLVREYFEDENL